MVTFDRQMIEVLAAVKREGKHKKMNTARFAEALYLARELGLLPKTFTLPEGDSVPAVAESLAQCKYRLEQMREIIIPVIDKLPAANARIAAIAQTIQQAESQLAEVMTTLDAICPLRAEIDRLKDTEGKR